MNFQIIGNNIPWNNNYKCHLKSIQQREKLYNDVINILDRIEPCETLISDKKYNLLQRIGSDSKSAEVFLFQLNEKNIIYNTAIKVLPIINKNSIEK